MYTSIYNYNIIYVYGKRHCALKQWRYDSTIRLYNDSINGILLNSMSFRFSSGIKTNALMYNNVQQT